MAGRWLVAGALGFVLSGPCAHGHAGAAPQARAGTHLAVRLGDMAEVSRPSAVPVQQPAPAQVERAVLAALQRDPRVKGGDIRVRYRDGVLTLRGTVPDLRAKWAAEQDALGVRGVTQVFNQLDVRSSR